MKRDSHFGPYPHQHAATMLCMREQACVRRGQGNFRHFGRHWNSDYSNDSLDEDWV